MEFQDRRVLKGNVNPEYNEILPQKLWLGNQDTHIKKEILQKLGI